MTEYEWEEKWDRNQAVVKRIEEGVAYRVVSDEFNITKQRVSQIYNRYKPKHKELIPLNDYCKLHGISRSVAINNFKLGCLKGKLIGHRYFVYKD